jgi:hypothetical protein
VNEASLCGLWDVNGKNLTGFTYSRIENSGNPDYYIVTSLTRNLKGLIDPQGRLIVDTAYARLYYLREDKFSVMVSGKWGVIDVHETFVLPPEYSTFIKSDSVLLRVQNDDGHFLVGQDYQVLGGPYQELNRPAQTTVYTAMKDDSTVFIDSGGKHLLTVAGTFKPEAQHGDFLIVKHENQKGVLGMNGRFLLEPIYRAITYLDFDHSYAVYSETERGLYNLERGWISPMSGYVQSISFTPMDANHDTKNISISTPASIVRYVNIWDRFEEPNPYRRHPLTNFNTNRVGEYTELVLPSNKKFRYLTDNSLSPISDGNTFYFKKKTSDGYDLLDTLMQSILPPGFFLKDAYIDGEKLLLELNNRERLQGIYEYGGTWLVGPEKNLQISRLSDQLWLKQEGKEYHLLDDSFEPLNDRIYESTKTMDAYCVLSYSETRVADIFSNDGKLLSEGESSEIVSVSNHQIAVKKDKGGYLLSCVVDAEFRNAECYPYAALYLLEGTDEYIVYKDLFDYGVMRKNGDIMIPARYSEIRHNPELQLFQLRKGGYVYDLVSENGKILFEDVSGYPDAKAISDDFMVYEGSEDTIVFHVPTRKHFLIPQSLGALRVNKDLIDSGLLYAQIQNKITYIDGLSGMIYAIE